jgi:hypothetical protein
MGPAEDFVLGRFFSPVRIDVRGIIFTRISYERGAGRGSRCENFRLGDFVSGPSGS